MSKDLRKLIGKGEQKYIEADMALQESKRLEREIDMEIARVEEIVGKIHLPEFENEK